MHQRLNPKLKKALRVICVLSLCFAFISGCMWLGSHKYRDNEANFQRIFGYPRPANITVHRSEVWYGRHFFLLFAESSWHIELDAPQDFIESLKTSGVFSSQRPPSKSRDVHGPAWFAPKHPTAYDRWDDLGEGGGFPVGSLFIDKETGRAFIFHEDL